MATLCCHKAYFEAVLQLVGKLWRDGDIAAKLSEYGAKSSMEMVAEAWAEYKMNPKPRPVALEKRRMQRTEVGSHFGII